MKNHDSSSPNGQTSLITLPLEIRQRILFYTLSVSDHRLIHSGSRAPWVELYRGKPSPSPAILSVCHQLYAECQQVLCRSSKLVVYLQPETVPRLAHLGIRKFVRYLDIAIPLLEQDSRISVRRKATTLLARPPEKLIPKLAATFPNVDTITLTLCPMLSRSLAVVPYMTGWRNYELRALLSQSWLVQKASKVRLQLDSTMTREVLEMVQAAGAGVDDRARHLAVLQRRLAQINELPAMRELDIYFTTLLSRPSHNRPIIWTIQQQQQAEAVGQTPPTPPMTASRAMLMRHLRTERQQMEGVVELLKELLPQVRTLNLFRMLYWRGTVMYEVVDLESSVELEVERLLSRRTIGSMPATTEQRTVGIRGAE
ncbi:uncharacterized protein A1O9_01485 [Exophiala aquamarina CBS 119918]|uniref:F-box domain-containing protein n=1 Tax=Exophiala aquamarina CBS 119918 TaxID=1182545 RepID=A0A072PUR9_9EURO|nr:uncharacterized protein A1O9_01485 [Exophiala aquamarina CBS 119918]KEF63507.1 hypothetical protein A1O9_01485 [Exophiala aquamarina CBS 119918]